jgi:tetratricopeptide (TPR) repeat protein
VNPWHPIALLGIALTVGMAVFAVVGIWNKKPFGWMLLFYLATMSIVSNLVFNIGVFMAERFLFLPSLAFCLLVPHLVTRFAKSKTLWAISGVVLVSFSALTMMRNPVWRDNTKLFRTDVENSPNSAKARTAGGAEAWKASKKETNPKKKADLLDEALLHINRAVEIYPGHALAWDFRGHILMDRMQYAEALQSYDKAISLQPESPLFVRNKGVAASVAKEYGQSAQAFEKYLKLAPSDASAWYDLGLVYENSKDYPKSVAAYEKCVSLQPTQSEALGKIGMIQGRYMNRGDSAIFYMEKALQVGGQQEWIYNNLGIAYAMQGNLVKSAEVLEKGVEKYPNSRDILPSLILTQTNLGNVARANELRARLNQQPQ